MLTAMVGTVVDPGSGHSIMNIVSWSWSSAKQP